MEQGSFPDDGSPDMVQSVENRALKSGTSGSQPAVDASSQQHAGEEITTDRSPDIFSELWDLEIPPVSFIEEQEPTPSEQQDHHSPPQVADLDERIARAHAALRNAMLKQWDWRQSLVRFARTHGMPVPRFLSLRESCRVVGLRETNRLSRLEAECWDALSDRLVRGVHVDEGPLRGLANLMAKMAAMASECQQHLDEAQSDASLSPEQRLRIQNLVSALARRVLDSWCEIAEEIRDWVASLSYPPNALEISEAIPRLIFERYCKLDQSALAEMLRALKKLLDE